MNSLTELLLEVLEESGNFCGVDTSQDRKTILARVENEGDSFLTITLPSFTKDLQKALDRGVVDQSLFVSFKRARGLVIPAFLQGFMSLIFDPLNGRIRYAASDFDFMDDTMRVNPLAIQAVSQITSFAGKIERECSPKRVDAAYLRYITNESHVRDFDSRRTATMLQEFRTMSHWVFGSLFRAMSLDITGGEIHPHHGPGSVADKLRGNAKWNQRSWPDRLEEVFPFGRYAFSGWRHYLDSTESGRDVPGTEIPVNVITVPKTLKTPRIIAVEPTSMQYMQQALEACFVDNLSSTRVESIVGYSSQEPNQFLARMGSLSSNHPEWDEKFGGSATLDLSDASDLVSNQLVREMVKDFPALLEGLDATRSRKADVHGHGVIRLAKFASMGSAMCFPIEAAVFTVIVFMALHEVYPNVHPSKLVESFDGLVRIYGDDIIVPKDAAQCAADKLEAFGLKVNRDKSFWNGYFRESCGKDYYDGFDVTIVRIRHDLPAPHMSASEFAESVMATSAMRNNFYERGWFSVVEWLDIRLLDALKGVYPYVGPFSSAIGRISHAGHQTDKWDDKLQRPMVKAFVDSSRSPASKLDGPGALMKVLSAQSGLPNPDAKHLERAGRPSSLRIKKRWVSAT